MCIIVFCHGAKGGGEVNLINKSLEMEWLDDSIPAARVCNSITAYISPHASLAMPLGSIVIAPNVECPVSRSLKSKGMHTAFVLAVSK